MMELPGTIKATLIAPTTLPPLLEYIPPKQWGPPDQPSYNTTKADLISPSQHQTSSSLVPSFPKHDNDNNETDNIFFINKDGKGNKCSIPEEMILVLHKPTNTTVTTTVIIYTIPKLNTSPSPIKAFQATAFPPITGTTNILLCDKISSQQDVLSSNTFSYFFFYWHLYASLYASRNFPCIF